MLRPSIFSGGSEVVDQTVPKVRVRALFVQRLFHSEGDAHE